MTGGADSMDLHAAVHVELDAGAVARQVAGEVQARAGDVVGHAEAAERDRLGDLGPLLVAQLALLDVGLDQPRGDRVDADLVGAELARHRARQAAAG